MTIQPIEAVDAIAHLDDFEPRRCEHSEHGTQPAYHKDGGELYVEIQCPGCEDEGYVKVICARYIGLAYSGKISLYCHCGFRTTEASDFYQILGPANYRSTK